MFAVLYAKLLVQTESKVFFFPDFDAIDVYFRRYRNRQVGKEREREGKSGEKQAGGRAAQTPLGRSEGLECSGRDQDPAALSVCMSEGLRWFGFAFSLLQFNSPSRFWIFDVFKRNSAKA